MKESGLCSGEKRNLGRIESSLKAKADVGPETMILTFDMPALHRQPRPGQFFMVKIQSPGFPLFGRAFSVFDYRPGKDRADVDFLVQAVGKGTAMLNNAQIGSAALLVGPAGNGFPAIEAKREIVLVGGGTGIAPLFHLLTDLHRRGETGADVRLLHGARDAASLYVHDRFSSLPFSMDVSTEDGSLGTAGMVDVLLEKALANLGEPKRARIFACGPDPMMRAVAHIGGKRGIETFLSLETRMACGTGICNGCVVPVDNGTPLQENLRYLRVCHEGPVFPAAILPDFRLP